VGKLTPALRHLRYNPELTVANWGRLR
jgi:hypothetical protein